MAARSAALIASNCVGLIRVTTVTVTNAAVVLGGSAFDQLRISGGLALNNATLNVTGVSIEVGGTTDCQSGVCQVSALPDPLSGGRFGNLTLTSFVSSPRVSSLELYSLHSVTARQALDYNNFTVTAPVFYVADSPFSNGVRLRLINSAMTCYAFSVGGLAELRLVN